MGEGVGKCVGLWGSVRRVLGLGSGRLKKGGGREVESGG